MFDYADYIENVSLKNKLKTKNAEGAVGRRQTNLQTKK